MSNLDTVNRFYQSLGNRDAEVMAACYADHVVFSDPAFPNLNGEEARDMWRMLCSRAKDLKLSFEVQTLTEERFRVIWHAFYRFSKTGRAVQNIITAELRLDSGLIVEHRDHFDFWRWSRQALGPIGYGLGWSSYLRKFVQKEARHSLQVFREGAR